MFRVYKIKPKVTEKIKALQVTKQQAALIATSLSGRVKMETVEGVTDASGVEFPTLDGVKFCPMGDWIVRHEDATFGIVEHTMFVENWEVARNTEKSS